MIVVVFPSAAPALPATGIVRARHVKTNFLVLDIVLAARASLFDKKVRFRVRVN